MLQKLPIGYSSLKKITDENCIYIDKTKHIYNLVQQGSYYFLSRPRRFGKSLLIDVLKQAFLSNEELFKGLYLDKNWDWTIKYPIIHLDFAAGIKESRENLDSSIHKMFERHFQEHDLIIKTEKDVATQFENLIIQLQEKYKRNVVILIDEYDKPILDNINHPAKAIELREGLKNCYSVIKKYDSIIKFVFITGVSRFSKVNLFSGLNHIKDITLDSRYADICGYTQIELEKYFKNYLIDVDKKVLKHWYNGYNFAGVEAQKVYNPFDILLFFDNQKQFLNYWIETGNPAFLLKLLQKNNYYLPAIENLITGTTLLGNLDVEKVNIETLLFQSGYLTIQKIVPNPLDNSIRYQLNYPNHEVRMSLNTQLLEYFLTNQIQLQTTQQQITQALQQKDFNSFKNNLSAFLASIPYFWQTQSKMANYEGFYATVVYSLLNAAGFDAQPEDPTNNGRIDLSLKIFNDYILIFEFKVAKNDSAKSALEQIKFKKYPEKYINQNLPIYIMGINFDKETRNVVDIAWELIK